jgi:hypothetical protein
MTARRSALSLSPSSSSSSSSVTVTAVTAVTAAAAAAVTVMTVRPGSHRRARERLHLGGHRLDVELAVGEHRHAVKRHPVDSIHRLQSLTVAAQVDPCEK